MATTYLERTDSGSWSLTPAAAGGEQQQPTSLCLVSRRRAPRRAAAAAAAAVVDRVAEMQVSMQRGGLTGSRPVVSGRAMQPVRATRLFVAAADERLRLSNLSPQKGSRRDNKRKGRGYGGHQGGTCGFGTDGQKARAGSGVRPGFEGGQTPLYRRLPKLRGIAGGMAAGLPKYVTVNLSELEGAFEDGATVDLQAVQDKKLLNISGRDTKLALKVLGEGSLSKKLTIKAAAFSSSAAEKISAAGATAEEQAGRKKWTRRAHEKRVKEMAAAGKDYKKEMSKLRAAKAAAKAKAAAAAVSARK